MPADARLFPGQLLAVLRNTMSMEQAGRFEAPVADGQYSVTEYFYSPTEYVLDCGHGLRTRGRW